MDNTQEINKEKGKTNLVEIIVRLIRPGSQYAYNVYDEYGNLVLEAHTPISEGLIKHLISGAIEHLYYDPSSIKNEDSGTSTGKPRIIDAALQSEMLDQSKKFLNHVKGIFTAKSDAGVSKVIVEESRALVNRVLESVESSEDGIFSTIDKLKSLDEYDFQHSTSVSVMGAILGTRLEFQKEVRASMGMGGLFHDLGKTSIAAEILTKIGKLSTEEFDIVREHPHVGYKLIEHTPYITDLEKRIVLLHHEKGDGTGYPFGFDHAHFQEQVPREVRLMSLVDVFSALTSTRPQGEKHTSKKALRLMLNMVYAPYKKSYQFLPADYRDFVRAMGTVVGNGEFFIGRGDLVRLNSGEVAIIEEMNSLYPLNPKIRIVKDRNLQNVKRSIAIDMLKNFNSYISNIFERTAGEPGTRVMTVQKINKDETI